MSVEATEWLEAEDLQGCRPMLVKLYGAIAELADETGSTDASIGQIAKAAGVSVTSIERALGRCSEYSVGQRKSGRRMVRTLLPGAADEDRSPMLPLQSR